MDLYLFQQCFKLHVLSKNLLLEYDKQAEQLDFQKTRARNFERQIDDLTKQLENSVQQVFF